MSSTQCIIFHMVSELFLIFNCVIKFTSTCQTIAVLFSHLSINGKVFSRYVYSTEGVKTCTLVRYPVDANVIAVKIIQQKELKFIYCIKYSKIQYTAKSFLITCIDCNYKTNLI